ncbi:hypothetical protein ASG17_14215 [Brevundimonas sp. Leaf363]|nr:hypothetical protein ASG17_14215 [Brevundimonas sp. Leaf363]
MGAVTAAAATPAAAQNYNGTPNYGEINLSAGFTPDPYLQVLRAGGGYAASNLSSECQGYVTEAPDVRLYWDGKGSLPIKISVMANADTSLIVNGPGGEWYCDDDGGDGTNPLVLLNAVPGRYEIWIGTYESGDSRPAVLSISEVTNF